MITGAKSMIYPELTKIVHKPLIISEKRVRIDQNRYIIEIQGEGGV